MRLVLLSALNFASLAHAFTDLFPLTRFYDGALPYVTVCCCLLQYHSQSKTQGYINEQARPCVFLVSMVLSLHSKRHEHTGENEQSKTKRKGGQSTPFDEKDNLTVQLHFLKRLTKMVVQKPKKKGKSKMTVLISKEFQTKSEMVAAKKQLKAEIHGTFDLERQEVRIPNGLIILQRKTSANQWLSLTNRISDFSAYMTTKDADYRLKTPDLILKATQNRKEGR